MGDEEGRSRYVDYHRVADRYRHGRELSPEVLERWRVAVLAALPSPPLRVLAALPSPPLRVLDVGAGTGMFAAAWRRWACAEVVAVEPNPAMFSAGYDGARYVRAVAEQLPLAPGSVDVAWVSTSLHHVTDLGRAIGECGRVLREGRRVLVRTFLPGRTEVTWLGAFPGRRRPWRGSWTSISSPPPSPPKGWWRATWGRSSRRCGVSRSRPTGLPGCGTRTRC